MVENEKGKDPWKKIETVIEEKISQSVKEQTKTLLEKIDSTSENYHKRMDDLRSDIETRFEELKKEKKKPKVKEIVYV